MYFILNWNNLTFLQCQVITGTEGETNVNDNQERNANAQVKDIDREVDAEIVQTNVSELVFLFIQ